MGHKPCAQMWFIQPLEREREREREGVLTWMPRPSSIASTMSCRKDRQIQTKSLRSNTLLNEHIINSVHFAWVNFEQAICIRLLRNIPLHHFHRHGLEDIEIMRR
uniref:Uncharacterized protein n=2 Tax=Opuntia streptacantha TaxID=393608 RepID=A0A7C8ZZA6_OPUST